MELDYSRGAARMPLGPPWSVLVVDDDAFAQSYLKGLLAQMSILDVTVVDSGAAALEKLRAGHRYKLMMLDLVMPGMDGFEFMEVAEGLGFGGGLVIVSGQDDVVRHGAALVARMRRFRLLGVLPKPAERNALSTLLASAL